MNEIPAKTVTVQKVDHTTGKTFIAENTKKSENTEINNKRIHYIGMFFKNKLIAVARFCTPQFAAMKKEYSNELLNIVVKNNSEQFDSYFELVKFYIQKYDPSDLFIYQSQINSIEEINYIKYGFTAVSYFDSSSLYNLKTTKKDIANNSVYEWINPNHTHYTYKITAAGSDKYYFGVSHVKIKNATIEDCLNDGYFGSGGKWSKNNKFNNWKNKHSETLNKEIIQVFQRKSDAYVAEKELVGESWKTDPLCLNTIEGGRYIGIGHNKKGSLSFEICKIHGLTKHIGDKCRKCINSKNSTMKECSIHGLTKHNGETCYQCLADKNVSLKNCAVHGMSKHLGNTCHKCINDDLIIMKECEIHGMSKHRIDMCYQCTSDKSISLRNCEIHGLVKHMGNTCANCTADKAISLKICETHGETKHIGDKCRKCINENNISLKTCPTHGKVKHVGNACYKCRNTKYVLNNCSTHGETYFVNNECLKCRENIVEMLECSIHGITKHMGNKCASCRSQNSINIRECLIHGETKHKGETCSKCTADKAAHRYDIEEKGKTKKDCSLCAKEITEGTRKPLIEKKPLINTCQLCHKEFEAKHKNQLFCSNPHTWECAICKTEITPVPRKGKTLYSCFAHRRELSLLNK